MRARPVSYDAVAKTIHWLTALAIIVMFGLAWTMTSDALPAGPLKFGLYQFHKSLGILILALSVLRIVWRLKHPAPRFPSHMPSWQRWVAILVHLAFYVLIIVLPLSGWLLVSATNHPVNFFGFFTLPNLSLPGLAEGGEVSGHMFAEAHESLAGLMFFLLLLHTAAALKHHFKDHDDVMLRMSPETMGQWLKKIRGAP